MRRDNDSRKVDIGQRRDRQKLVTNHAEHKDRQHQERGSDRARMKISDMFIRCLPRLGHRLGLLDVDFDAVIQAILAIDHDVLAAVKAICNDRNRTLAVGHIDIDPVDRFVGIDHVDI